MAWTAEFHQSPDLGRQCDTAAPGTHHQHRRNVQRIRHLPCAGLCGVSKTVIEAHGPL